jgi:hypothetical protein
MGSIEAARAAASGLPRSYEAVVRGHVKFRVGRIVYAAFSRDETLMGFAFPKELRAGLVESEPAKFLLPSRGDMRYNWVVVRLDAAGDEEVRQLILDAWAMCVPRGVAAAHRAAG